MIIESFKKKNGDQLVKLGKLTVFVGPNNCGKSQTLKDIASLMNAKEHSKIVSELSYTQVDFSVIEKLINVSDHKRSLNTKTIVGIGENFSDIEQNVGASEFELSKTDQVKMFNFYNRFRMVLLDSTNRISVIKETSTGGLEQDRASNLLQLAYLDESKEIFNKFQDIFKKTFQASIYLDYTALSQISLRVSEEDITLSGDTQKDRLLLKVLEKIDDQGEGYKSFAATVLGLVSAKNRLVLLDEPEVFLHNAQQKQLGRWVGEFVKNNETQLIIATHSPSFLEGLLASGVDVNIQRLNRDKSETTFTKIDAAVVKQFTSDPILSSQRVLDAIFQKAVVVCEADTDRMIYKIVADKIKSSHEVLFIHAHNKQTVPSVVKILRASAVPVYSILDIDIFHEDKEYAEILDAHEITLEPEHYGIQGDIKNFVNGNRRDAEIIKELKSTLDLLDKSINEKDDITALKATVGKLNKLFSNWRQFKKQGLNFISEANINGRATKLIEYLAGKGLYIVKTGELETWIPGDHAKGKNWVNYAVSKLEEGVPAPLSDFVGRIFARIK